MSRIIILELDGRIPSKKNSKQIRQNFKTGKRFITSSDRFSKWHEVACYQINLQKSSIDGVDFPIQKCEYIKTTIFYPDFKVRDNTNVADSVHDLLVDTGIIADDNWKVTGRTEQIPIYREKQAGATIIIKTHNPGEDGLSEESGTDGLGGKVRNESKNVLTITRRDRPAPKSLRRKRNKS